MTTKPNVSIIIRTKNEERWITQCLDSVSRQNYPDFEVIIVDNKSTDKTIEKARQFNVVKQVVTCEDFLPGKALNMGIEKAKGDFIVCLSGHCIPTDPEWLRNLLGNFDSNDDLVAGAYGRQEPLSFTSDPDKRDLALIFGMDKKVQIRDSFFHNANSIIRREIWESFPFDGKVTNIEDRVWAQTVQENGYKIIYDPTARVYHYHGIHQDGNVERCTNVVQILESLRKDHSYRSIEIDKLNTVALIPLKGEVKYLGGKPLLAYTIERAMESKYIKKVIISTADKEIRALAISLGAEVPFMRDLALSKDDVDLDQVLSYSLCKLEEEKIFPDLIVSLETTFPFRPRGLIDNMIVELAENGFDTVIAARRENKAIWKEEEGKIKLLNEGLTPRKYKDPTLIELRGVATVTHPEFLRKGCLMGEKIGLHEVHDPYSHLEVREKEDFELAQAVIGRWS